MINKGRKYLPLAQNPSIGEKLAFGRISALADYRHAEDLVQFIQMKQTTICKISQQHNGDIFFQIADIQVAEPMPPPGVVYHLVVARIKRAPTITVVKQLFLRRTVSCIGRVERLAFQ